MITMKKKIAQPPTLKKPHGGKRNMGGRRLETGNKAERKDVTLDPADIEFLKSPQVGDGNLSRGIRVAAKFMRENRILNTNKS